MFLFVVTTLKSIGHKLGNKLKEMLIETNVF